jgi:hypothetical protein
MEKSERAPFYMVEVFTKQGTYIDGAILSLPAEKRPKQRPIIKGAASGNIILARYPNLARSHMAVDGFNPY